MTDRAQTFVNSILQLAPRVAVFDCDGTLWSGDAGETFFRWELNENLLPKAILDWAMPRYSEYKAGNVAEEVMCGEMVTMHRGLIETDVQRTATRFFDLFMYEQIFPEMRDLVRRLQAQGSDVWAVSSTNEWVIRAAMRHFDIPRDHILAASVEIKDNRITDRLMRIPSGDGKPKAIREVIRKDPDAAFGNSRWDTEMLEISRHPVAVNPNPDLERIARDRGWTIYRPAATNER
jgi:HAD superfamily hydrolase (TIGR01490 family)